MTTPVDYDRQSAEHPPKRAKKASATSGDGVGSKNGVGGQTPKLDGVFAKLLKDAQKYKPL